MAMAVFVQDGDCIDYTPTADVASGDVVIVNNIIAVATSQILNGKLGAVQMTGVFDFAKATAATDNGAVGTNWYWDNTAFKATKTATGNILIGVSVPSAAGANGVLAADTLVRIKLDEGTHTTNSGKDVKVIPIALAGLVNAQVRRLAIPFAFELVSFGIRTGTIATTAAKLATITAGIAAVPVTGGIASLTTVSNSVSGTLTAATAITAGGLGNAGDAIEFTVSAVTAFVEGDAVIEAIIQRK
ncbi:MAG TPA: DUF2190 family protein [Candidatus Saccharimonadales bacterium]|nr:DUF2190 family protein [Candidatus Saccharimonadales bacterium]